MSDEGRGTISSVVAGIEWAVEQGIAVMNMSLGSKAGSETLREACDRAYERGHLLVAAAGNAGEPSGEGEDVIYPAAYSSVIAVAASDVLDRRADFSSTGPEVELIAPGVDVDSTWPGDEYHEAKGTSAAAPHVAGVAALVWAANPDLTNVQVRQVLRDTAEDLGLDANHQGYGLVRADSAVARAPDVETGTVTLHFSERIRVVPGETLDLMDFTVTYDGVPVMIQAIQQPDGSSDRFDLTMAVAPEAGQTVTVTIEPTGAAKIADLAGNLLCTRVLTRETTVSPENLD